MRPYIHAAETSSDKDSESHNFSRIPKIYPEVFLVVMQSTYYNICVARWCFVIWDPEDIVKPKRGFSTT